MSDMERFVTGAVGFLVGGGLLALAYLLWVGLGKGAPTSRYDDDDSIVMAAGGNLAGLPYAFSANPDGNLTLTLTLPKRRNVHMVMLGTKGVEQYHNMIGLKPIELEGNYATLFTVLCEPGREAVALEFLDPSDMAYLADFCQAYTIEIQYDTLLISSQEGHTQSGDTTSMLQDAETLIKRNRIFFS